MKKIELRGKRKVESPALRFNNPPQRCLDSQDISGEAAFCLWQNLWRAKHSQESL